MLCFFCFFVSLFIFFFFARTTSFFFSLFFFFPFADDPTLFYQDGNGYSKQLATVIKESRKFRKWAEKIEDTKLEVEIPDDYTKAKLVSQL